MTSKVLLIYTGGTIGMNQNPLTGALEPFDFEHLLSRVPELAQFQTEIATYQFNPPIDSSDMSPRLWTELAHIIADHYDEYDGFVVLHGTDTMAYTASALSFMLDNLAKPVIITGSQLPIGEVRTDGEENLITALQVAAATGKDGEAIVQEVAILFENYLWRGNRSTKMSADNFNAFKSNNYPELAKIGLGITFHNEALYRMSSRRPLKVRYTMDPNVMVLTLHPGMTESTLQYLLDTPGIKGIVLRTYGAGNCPSEPWFLNLIHKATQRGLVIVNVTQCVNGGVNDTLYETGSQLNLSGVISGHDITCEAALTKLMYLFGLGLSPEEVKKYMNCAICGEVSL